MIVTDKVMEHNTRIFQTIRKILESGDEDAIQQMCQLVEAAEQRDKPVFSKGNPQNRHHPGRSTNR
jgi:hypothetical protein